MGYNVRLDYAEECVNRGSMSLDDICNEVVEGNRCQYDADNCNALAQPEDGCCPICGTINSEYNFCWAVFKAFILDF